MENAHRLATIGKTRAFHGLPDLSLGDNGAIGETSRGDGMPRSWRRSSAGVKLGKRDCTACHGADAKLCIDAGMDGVLVLNHGGEAGESNRGARTVYMGRPDIWERAAFGQPRVERVLDLLRLEPELVMSNAAYYPWPKCGVPTSDAGRSRPICLPFAPHLCHFDPYL